MPDIGRPRAIMKVLFGLIVPVRTIFLNHSNSEILAMMGLRSVMANDATSERSPLNQYRSKFYAREQIFRTSRLRNRHCADTSITLIHTRAH